MFDHNVLVIVVLLACLLLVGVPPHPLRLPLPTAPLGIAKT